MKIIRAISIRQPYVELILMGKKKFEYRSMATNIRERVYLYASNQQGGSEAQLKQTGKSFEELPKGMIVGSVEIVDCKWNESRDCYAYKLSSPIRLKRNRKPVNHPSPVFWRPTF